MTEISEPEYWEMLIKRSVSRLFLLNALHQRPMHGYEVARYVRTNYPGCCDPSDAMIYPALRELLEGGYVECLVESTGGRERKVCKLTEKGEGAYRAAAGAWERALPFISQAAEAARGRPRARKRRSQAKSEALNPKS